MSQIEKMMRNNSVRMMGSVGVMRDQKDRPVPMPVPRRAWRNGWWLVGLCLVSAKAFSGWSMLCGGVG